MDFDKIHIKRLTSQQDTLPFVRLLVKEREENMHGHRGQFPGGRYNTYLSQTKKNSRAESGELMKRWTLLVLCLLAGLAHGVAQGNSPVVPAKLTVQQPDAPASSTATAQHRIDPAKEADIRRLLEVMGVKKVVDETIQSLMQSLRPVLSNSLPAGDYREKLIDLFNAKFQSKVDVAQLLELGVPAYDKYFSHEEIKGLLAFYATPVGQKSIAVMPQLMNEMREAGRKWGEQLGRASMSEVLEEHPEMKAALEEAGKRANQQ